MPLTDFYNKIVALQEFDIEKISMDIISENEEYVVDLIQTQLSDGERGDGEKTNAAYGKPYYQKKTIEIKLGKDQEIGFVTMKDTGDFYNSLKLKLYKNTFEIVSDVPQFEEINKIWNDDKLVELNYDNRLKFTEEILKPELQRRFNLAFNK